MLKLFLLAIPFFFALNGYQGLVVDGPLYVLQVINTMHPERFVGDVAFAYGNQDSFSLFTPIYRFFIIHFGVEAGSRYLCLIMQSLFAVAWTLLVKVVWEKYCKEYLQSIKAPIFFVNYFPITLCLLCMGIYAYGTPLSQTEFLRFVEGYAVSRLPSIAFGIAGIAFLLAERKKTSLVLLLIGTLMHPLMAGWGLPLWMFVYYPKSIKFVIIGAILLPLTIFIDKVPLASYPEDWLTRPFNFAPTYDDVAKFVVFVAFFFVCSKNLENSYIQKICKATSIIISIALYWWMWGGYAHHIFLYQVQCFRIEWICMVLVVPLFVLLILGHYRKYRVSGRFSTYDFALLAFAIALFLPMRLLEFAMLGLILFLRKERPLFPRLPQVVFLLVSLIALCYQTYLRMSLEGLPLVVLRRISDAYRIADSLIMAECVFAIMVAFYMLKKKRFELSAGLALFCLFPALQLVPLVVCYVWIQPKQNKKVVFSLLLVAIAEGVLNYDIRISHVAYSGPLTLVFVLWGAFVACVGISRFLSQRPVGRLIPLFLYAVVTATYAYANWDSRSAEMIVSEKQMDAFIGYDIFANHPEIADHGKVFYYVEGFAVAMPRLQFLNGGYYDENSLTGALFFEGQYREGNRRRNNLLLKSDDGDLSDYAKYRNFVSSVLSKRDSLVDRIDYLCNKGEITHFVSDGGMSNTLLDSILLNVLEKKVYLYSCFARE